MGDFRLDGDEAFTTDSLTAGNVKSAKQEWMSQARRLREPERERNGVKKKDPDPSYENASCESGRGALILTLGILGLILGAPLGPFVRIMGKGALEKMTFGRMDSGERSLRKTGGIRGIIGALLLGLGAVGFALTGAVGMVRECGG